MPNIFEKVFRKRLRITETESVPYVITTSKRGLTLQDKVTDYVAQWKNHHIYRAIDFTAKSMQKVKWYLEQDGEPLPEKNKYAKKYYQLLKKPFEKCTWRQLIYLWVCSLEATGNTYLLKFGDSLRPEKLYFIPPDKTKIIVTDTNPIAGYQLDINSALKNFVPDVIIHSKYPNLADPQGYGIGPFQAALGQYNNYEYVTDYANILLQNIGVPPIVLEWGKTPEQTQRMVSLWIENWSGYKNAGKTSGVPEGTNIHRFAFSPSEINFTGIQEAGEKSLYKIFGVPRVLIDPEKATYANAYQARLSFYENKQLPIAEDIAETITEYLILEPSISFKFAMELPKDPAMEMKRERMYLEMNVMSPNQSRGNHGWFPYNGGDDVYRSLGEVPVATIQEKKGKKSAPNIKVYRPKVIGIRSWKTFYQWQNAVEKRFAKEVDKYFSWVGKEVSKNLRKLSPKGFDDPTLSDMVILSYIILTDKMKEQFNPYIIESIEKAFTQKMSELGGDVSRMNIEEYIKQYINNLEKTWKGIAETDIKQLKKLLSEGMEQDMTMNEMSRYVNAKYDPLSPDYMNKHRAMTISRTETGGAANKTSHDTIDVSGIMWRSWFSALTEASREAHVAAHGQVKPVKEPFIVGGEPLMYPGDRNGSASNVINCLCIEVPEEALEV